MDILPKLKNPYILIGSAFLIGLMIVATALVYERAFVPLPILGPQDEDKTGEERYHHIPEFTLIDQSGDTITHEQLKGKIYVADFFFTHCPSICPKMTAHLKEIQDKFDKEDISFVSYTVDPKRDRPERLMEYARTYEAELDNWSFITGDKKQIYLLARNGYFISASEGSGGPDDFIHSDLFTLVDEKGRIRGYYRGTQDDDIQQLIQDIEKLKSES